MFPTPMGADADDAAGQPDADVWLTAIGIASTKLPLLMMTKKTNNKYFYGVGSLKRLLHFLQDTTNVEVNDDTGNQKIESQARAHNLVSFPFDLASHL